SNSAGRAWRGHLCLLVCESSELSQWATCSTRRTDAVLRISIPAGLKCFSNLSCVPAHPEIVAHVCRVLGRRIGSIHAAAPDRGRCQFSLGARLGAVAATRGRDGVYGLAALSRRKPTLLQQHDHVSCTASYGRSQRASVEGRPLMDARRGGRTALPAPRRLQL